MTDDTYNGFLPRIELTRMKDGSLRVPTGGGLKGNKLALTARPNGDGEEMLELRPYTDLEEIIAKLKRLGYPQHIIRRCTTTLYSSTKITEIGSRNGVRPSSEQKSSIGTDLIYPTLFDAVVQKRRIRFYRHS